MTHTANLKKVYQAAARGEELSAERLQFFDQFADKVSQMLEQGGFSVQRSNEAGMAILSVNKDDVSLPFMLSSGYRKAGKFGYRSIEIKSFSEKRELLFFKPAREVFEDHAKKDIERYANEIAEFVVQRLGLKSRNDSKPMFGNFPRP